MTCSVCEGCDEHCIEGDAIRCALLTVKYAAACEPPRHEAAIGQLAWALRAQKGLSEAAAAAAAAALTTDVH